MVLVFWVLALITLPVFGYFDDMGWDTAIYLKAIHALQAGHDPYIEATTIQLAVHSKTPDLPNLHGPYSYVYAPITLPLLRLAGWAPLWASGLLYYALYLLGALAEVWAGYQAVEPQERNLFRYLAPAAIFFPGFLLTDNILSGNIAYLLYGAVLVAALTSCRTGRWRWFYGVTLIASCFKIPLLSLLVLPLLLARRQWRPAMMTGALGLALFGAQAILVPTLFQHYLQAVELQFSINRDFGFSPAGIFSGALYDRHLAYSPAALIFYLLYAVPLLATLLVLSRRYLAGRFTLTQWLPVLLTGVILLNPRLIEYDAAPLALPLSLIAWRCLRSFTTRSRATIALAAVFAVLNGIAMTSWPVWKLTECPLLVSFFVVGALMLFRRHDPAAGWRPQATERSNRSSSLEQMTR